MLYARSYTNRFKSNTISLDTRRLDLVYTSTRGRMFHGDLTNGSVFVVFDQMFLFYNN